MADNQRKTGIDVLGDIPWGTHFCQFYETKNDLLELLVPYFKAGLENNEFCLWITCNPLTVENAFDALRESVRDFDQHLKKKSIEIHPYTDWYLKEGKFNAKFLMDGWFSKLHEALARGYEGMRINGNETWLESNDWKDFMKYERKLNNALRGKPIILLCTYSLSRSAGGALLDVAHAHECVVSKRNGHWEILEEPEIKKINSQLKGKNDELEQQVAERTNELVKVIEQLKKEIAERERVEAELKKSELRYRTLIDQASDAIIISDEEGRLLEVNQSFCGMVGYSEKELIGMDISNLLDTEYSKADPFRYDLLLEGKALFRERQMKKRDGTVFPIEEHVKMIGTKRILAIVRDITRRKQVEEKLRQSESLLVEAEKIAQIGSWRLDFHSNTVTWSDELYRMFGVKKSEFDHTLESIFKFIHPDDCAFVKRVIEEAVKTHEPYNFYFRMIRSDGKERIIHARGAVMMDEQGNAVRMYGAAQDVTERKQAENDLQLAYQRLSYHVENTPLAVIEWDKDLCIKRWSKRAEEIFGWKASEVLGKKVDDPDFRFVHKSDKQTVDKIVEQLMKGIVDRNLALNRNYTKDGKIIYSEWYNSALRDEQGNVITVLSLIHNVTEKKVAEEQIRQSEAHLAEAQRVAKIGSWDLDLQADKLTWSEELYCVFGIDKQTFDETHGSFLHLIDKEDRERVQQINRHTQKTGEPFTIEYHITTPKGERRTIQEHGYGQTDEQGRVVRLVGTVQDITEGKRAEESLQQSYEKIRRLNEHLQNIREEERTRIARDIHDELGQQLTVLKMDVSWLTKKLNEAEPLVKEKLQELTRLLDSTVQSVRRIATELRPSLLDDLGLAAAMEWHLKEFEKRSGIKTIFREPEEEPPLSNPVKTCLYRIFQESLTNVARHSGATEVLVDLKRSDEALILSIKDNGKGFDAQKLSEKKTLGLVGMKERTAMMGGDYRIHTMPGKGTTVTVLLPIDKTN